MLKGSQAERNLTVERLYYEEQDLRAQSFLSPITTHHIREMCEREPLFEQAWRAFTDRVRAGLNDTIVEGWTRAIMVTISAYHHAEAARVQQRDALNSRNLDNIRLICGAARAVVLAYQDAEARGDIGYMEAAVEELEAAVFDLTGKDVFDAE